MFGVYVVITGPVFTVHIVRPYLVVSDTGVMSQRRLESRAVRVNQGVVTVVKMRRDVEALFAVHRFPV